MKQNSKRIRAIILASLLSLSAITPVLAADAPAANEIVMNVLTNVTVPVVNVTMPTFKSGDLKFIPFASQQIQSAEYTVVNNGSASLKVSMPSYKVAIGAADASTVKTRITLYEGLKAYNEALSLDGLDKAVALSLEIGAKSGNAQIYNGVDKKITKVFNVADIQDDSNGIWATPNTKSVLITGGTASNSATSGLDAATPVSIVKFSDFGVEYDDDSDDYVTDNSLIQIGRGSTADGKGAEDLYWEKGENTFKFRFTGAMNPEAAWADTDAVAFVPTFKFDNVVTGITTDDENSYDVASIDLKVTDIIGGSTNPLPKEIKTTFLKKTTGTLVFEDTVIYLAADTFKKDGKTISDSPNKTKVTFEATDKLTGLPLYDVKVDQTNDGKATLTFGKGAITTATTSPIVIKATIKGSNGQVVTESIEFTLTAANTPFVNTDASKLLIANAAVAAKQSDGFKLAVAPTAVPATFVGVPSAGDIYFVPEAIADEIVLNETTVAEIKNNSYKVDLSKGPITPTTALTKDWLTIGGRPVSQIAVGKYRVVVVNRANNGAISGDLVSSISPLKTTGANLSDILYAIEKDQ